MSSNPLGPRTLGHDFNFFKKVNVSSLEFNNSADIFIPFNSESISIINEGGGIVQYSFNGNAVHGELNPKVGTSNITITGQGISKIWFKLEQGSNSNVRVQSNASIENLNSFSANSPGIPIRIGNSTSSDGFGRLRVAAPFTIFDSKNILDDQPLIWSTKTSVGGTSVYDGYRASVFLNTTSTIGSQTIRQTKARFYYQPGKSALIFMTFIMGETPEGVRKRAGYFTPFNGIFLEIDGSDIYFIIRSSASGSPIDTQIHQDDWNIDNLDGFGPSGAILDLNKIQLLSLEFEWLGAGRVRFGFVIEGTNYPCHEFYAGNEYDSVFMSTPNLPLRFEIENISGNEASSLEQICTSIMSMGGYEHTGILRSADRGSSVFGSISAGAQYPLISFRLAADKQEGIVIPVFINVVCTTASATFRWALILNPTIAGTDNASWTSVTNSVAEYDISRNATNTITGGTLMASGYAIQSSGSRSIVESTISTNLLIGSNLDGVSDQIVLIVEKLDGGSDSFTGSISWKEFY